MLVIKNWCVARFFIWCGVAIASLLTNDEHSTSDANIWLQWNIAAGFFEIGASTGFLVIMCRYGSVIFYLCFHTFIDLGIVTIGCIYLIRQEYKDTLYLMNFSDALVIINILALVSDWIALWWYRHTRMGYSQPLLEINAT